MSRSYRKPFWTDQQRSRKSASRASRSVEAKRNANQTVRRMNKQACQGDESAKLASGKSYRKASCSWDIRDWTFHDPKSPKVRRK